MPELMQHALARGWARGDTAASLLAILYQMVQMTHTSWFEKVGCKCRARFWCMHTPVRLPMPHLAPMAPPWHIATDRL